MPVSIAHIGPPTTLEAGKTIDEGYFFGNSVDVGVCYCSYDTTPQWLGQLDTERQGMTQGPGFIGGVPHLELRSTTYTITTRNRSNFAVGYNFRVAILTGG